MPAGLLGSLVVLATLGLASCAFFERPWPAARGSEAVALRFDWPLGLSSRVSFAQRQRSRTPDRVATSQWTGSYRMTVLAAPEGRLIRSDDFELAHPLRPPASAGQSRESALRELGARLSSFVPSLVIDDAGAVVRIEGMARLRAEMKRMIAPLTEGLPDPAAATGELLDSLVSEQSLALSGRQDWSALVGSWAGKELEPGVLYEVEDVEQLPLLGGVAMPTLHELSLIQLLPCPTATRTPRCVELEMRSSPRPEALAAVLDQLLSTAPVSDEPVLDALAFETRVHLITEPATLTPHSVEITRSRTVTLRRGGVERIAVESEERRSFRFRYAD